MTVDELLGKEIGLLNDNFKHGISDKQLKEVY